MKSRSKFLLDNSKVTEIFKKFSDEDILKINPLNGGEYNSLYEICTKDKKYILKVAPEKNFTRLTYEEGMMKAEIYWYSMMREKAGIKVPEIYFTDFSKTVIPADYFIMEKIEAPQKDQVKFTKEEKQTADAEIVKQAAKLHAVHNEKFGYVQGELFDNWYDAYHSIIYNLISDAEKKGKKSKNGEKLLKYAEKYQDVLKSAESSMVNTDCWESNIMCKKENGSYSYIWIDPERSMWGDRIFDFICFDPLSPLDDTRNDVKIYNSVSNEKITCNNEAKIRYAFAKGLLALVMEVEKYYRYTPLNFGWWRNAVSGKTLYNNVFNVLEKRKGLV